MGGQHQRAAVHPGLHGCKLTQQALQAAKEDHDHEHDHDHGCEEHACDGCSGGSDKCKNESVALLNYMVDHNEHHAAELDQMADNLAKLGMDTAAKQIKEAVADFQKGNLRLRLALTTVKEELKEF